MKAIINHHTHDGNPLARPHLTPTYLASRGKHHLEFSALDSHTSSHSSWAGQYPWSKDTTFHNNYMSGIPQLDSFNSIFILLKKMLFLSNYVSMCLHVDIGHECRCSWRFGSLRSWESLHVGARI